MEPIAIQELLDLGVGSRCVVVQGAVKGAAVRIVRDHRGSIERRPRGDKHIAASIGTEPPDHGDDPHFHHLRASGFFFVLRFELKNKNRLNKNRYVQICCLLALVATASIELGVCVSWTAVH